MPTLFELQSSFFDGLRGLESAISFKKGPIDPRDTWEIYRTNYLETHVAALADTYSTVLHLVGEEYFRQIACSYVRKFRSDSGDLNDYGAHFADHIASILPRLPKGETLPYLSDIAALDWAWFEVLRSPKATNDWLAKLSASNPELWEHTKATPACRWMKSEFPIYQIWQLSQGKSDTIQLSQAESILITRTDRVRLTKLNEAEIYFITSWFSGKGLGAAFEDAQSVDQEFNLLNMIQLLAAHNAIQTIEILQHENLDTH